MAEVTHLPLITDYVQGGNKTPKESINKKEHEKAMNEFFLSSKRIRLGQKPVYRKDCKIYHINGTN